MKKSYALPVSGVLLPALSPLVTTKPVPVSWLSDLTLKDKFTLNYKVLFNLLPDFFSDVAITTVQISLYTFTESNQLIQQGKK